MGLVQRHERERERERDNENRIFNIRKRSKILEDACGCRGNGGGGVAATAAVVAAEFFLLFFFLLYYHNSNFSFIDVSTETTKQRNKIGRLLPYGNAATQ